MKKAFCLMMALVLTVSVFAMTALSASAAALEYTVQTVNCEKGDVIAKGEKVSIDFIVNEQPSIIMVELKVRYNKTLLKPVAGEAKGVLATFAQKEVNLAPADPVIGKDHATLGEIWITGMDLDNHSTENGHVIATVEFEALEDITETCPIYGFGDPLAADIDYNELKGSCINGGIVFPVETTTTTEATTTTTEAAVTTTTEAGATTTTAKATTTTKKPAKDDNPKTGEGDAWIIIAVIGVAAVAIVVLATAMSKKSKARELDED